MKRRIFIIALVLGATFLVSASSYALPIFSNSFDATTGWNVVGADNEFKITHANPQHGGASDDYGLISATKAPSSVYIWRTIDATAYQGLNLSYARTTYKFNDTATFTPAWGLDGITWNVLETVTKANSNEAWATVNFNLPSSADYSTIYIRFLVSSTDKNNFGLVDDLALTGSGITSVPEPTSLGLLGLGLLGLLRRKVLGHRKV